MCYIKCHITFCEDYHHDLIEHAAFPILVQWYRGQRSKPTICSAQEVNL